VRYDGEPSCGASWAGGTRSWNTWDGVEFHEWGHNLGMGNNESTFRSKTSNVLNPDVEYIGDNVYSALHNADPKSVWTVPDMKDIGVLDDACLIRPTASGTYRIYTHQVGPLTFNTNQKYALELLDGGRPLTFEYHHLVAANLDSRTSQGLIVLRSDSNDAIDTTPRSRTGEDDRLDAALLIGRTLTSFDRKWTIKPKAKGGSGEFTYVDVEVVLR
jgi:hypothetical protein